MAEKRAKRDHGDGSIMKRNDGRWVAKIQIGTKADGKPNIKSFYGKSSPEVKRKLKDFKNGLIKNSGIEVSKNTVSSYVMSWLEDVKIHQVKRSSFDKTKWIIEHIITKYIGYIQIGSLVPSDIQLMINQMQQEDYSSSIIRQAYYVVKDCLNLGVTKRELLYNPAIGVVLPKKSSHKDESLKILSDEEIKMLTFESERKYQNGKNVYRLGASVIALLNTGMRIGELCALEWQNVDFDNKRVYITQNLSRVSSSGDKNTKQELIITETKTKNSNRTIPLNTKAYEAFKKLHEETGTQSFVIFNNNTNYHMLPNSVSLFFNKMLEKCNIPKRGIHSLRHTFASKLIRKGVDIKTVSMLLGHADITITYNTYVHIIDSQKVNAVDMIDF